MAKYYIQNGNDKEGPYEKPELQAKIIKASTQVWCEGMIDWGPAGTVEELKDLFREPPPFVTSKAEPPPIKKTEPKAATPIKKRGSRKLLWTALALTMLFGFGYMTSGINSGTGGFGSSYEAKVMTVEEEERADPVRFLEASGSWNENFWGNKLKVHGIVTSTATVAQYKDIVIQVTYYSETKTVLGTEQYVLYKFVPPHGKTEFDLTLKKPEACKQLGWDVVSAVPV